MRQADTLRVPRSLLERTREFLSALPEPGGAATTPESFQRHELVGELGASLQVSNADYCPGCATRGTQIESLRILVRAARELVEQVPADESGRDAWLAAAALAVPTQPIPERIR